MKRAIISEPVYQAEFLIQRGGTLQSCINEFAKRVKVDEWPHITDPTGCFIFFEPLHAGAIWLSDIAGAGTITHEAFHATYYIFTKKGLQLNEGSEEAFAYYLQWMVNEITEKLFYKKGKR